MLLKLIGEFHKVVRYKIDIEKSILFIYQQQSEIKIEMRIPFTIA